MIGVLMVNLVQTQNHFRMLVFLPIPVKDSNRVYQKGLVVFVIVGRFKEINGASP